MRFVTDFSDFELIDAAAGERLERWGDIFLIRPDPQVIWGGAGTFKDAHARYIRSNKGGGAWETYKHIPEVWSIGYMDLTFRLKPMGFKHTGLFPEQAVNWRYLYDTVSEAVKTRPVTALNLFAYTGGATLAMAAAGANVTHVDASKGMVNWAKENAVASDIPETRFRFITDDCLKFVKREIRRGKKYDCIVLDPPSYGRGPDGEIWHLEDSLSELLSLLSELLSDNALCLLLNTYTSGLSTTIIKYMCGESLVKVHGGTVEADEIGLAVTQKDIILPCGNTTIWSK